MTITEINLITFSPTHTSKQIGEAIVRGMGIADVSFVDMTLQAPEKKEFGSDARYLYMAAMWLLWLWSG